MAQDDIQGVMGAPGGPRGRQGAPGGSRLPPAPKRVIKQQKNGPKPWFKAPKVCPDQKGMVLIHFWGIWGHLGALKQRYLVKTSICQKPDFGKIYLYPPSTGHLEKKKKRFAIFQQYTYTQHCWKILKNQNHFAKLAVEGGSSFVILFKKIGYFFSKIQKKFKKI